MRPFPALLSALLVLRAAAVEVPPGGDIASAVREAAKQPAGERVVRLLPGVHRPVATIELGETESGEPGAPLRIEGAGPGVEIEVSRPLSPTFFTDKLDAAETHRLRPESRGKVVRLTLAEAGLTGLKPYPDNFSDNGGLFEFYADGQRQPLARWPNAGDTSLAKVLEKGDDRRGPDTKGGVFQYRENRISTWAGAAASNQVWVAGYWYAPWIHETVRVKSIDPATKTIFLSTGVSRGIGSKYAGPEGAGTEPFHVVNLLEELDQPGEWCVDFTAGRLYFWPPKPVKDLSLSVADRTTPVFRIKNARHVTLRGFAVGGGLGDGVEIAGGEDVRLEAVEVRRQGRNGVVIQGGKAHQVLSCDIHHTGHAGLVMGGGDRLTLTPCGHVADNNHIHAVGRVKKTYTPGITVSNNSVGIRVTHNRIHDSPHAGVLHAGNDHVFEYNEIYDVVSESDDMGAFYTSNDWTSQGNTLRYNFIHHSPRATGIYCDDGDSGELIEGNLFYRTMCGPFIGGGHDHVVRGNVAIACGRALHLDSRGIPRGYATNTKMLKQLADVKPDQPPWKDRFPTLATLAADQPDLPRNNRLEGNVGFASEKILNLGGKPEEFRRCVLTNNLEVALADLGFADMANLNFRMSDSAPALKRVPGLAAIPFAKIGLYTNALRRTLPAREPAFAKALLPPDANSKAFRSMLVVESPTFLQVVQRDARGAGQVEVKGSVGPTVDAVRYRVTGQPKQGDLPDAWTTAAVDAASRRFSSPLTLPAGGWYRLEVHALSAGQVQSHWFVDRFGVGEVFVVAGQSNAANHGGEKLRTETGRVSTFDGARWHLCEDPQRGASGKDGSFLPAFGDELSRRLDLPVGVVPIAVGATSVREWLPAGTRFPQQPTTGANVRKHAEGGFEATGKLFDTLAARLTALGPNGARAVLWHQGESDAGQARGGYPADRQISGEQYTAFMKTLIDASRAKAGWALPWGTAVTTYHSEKDAADEEFRAAQQAMWKLPGTFAGPDTDALRKEYRDGVHFNGKGLREHGRLWAESVETFIGKGSP